MGVSRASKGLTPPPWDWYGCELLSPEKFVLSVKEKPSDADAKLIASAPLLLSQRDDAITLLAEFAIANGERGPFHPSSWAGKLGPLIHAEIEKNWRNYEQDCR